MQMPIMYELRNKNVLIIGGGKVAYRKAMKLSECRASITCVSKAFDPRFENLKQVKCIEEIIRHNAINESYFEQVDMVIAATNNTILNERIYKFCHERRIMCMTVDKLGSSDFSFMAYEEKKGLLLAASTRGASPLFSSEIINTFMDSIDDETFKRLDMMMQERRLMLNLKKK